MEILLEPAAVGNNALLLAVEPPYVSRDQAHLQQKVDGKVLQNHHWNCYYQHWPLGTKD